MRRTLKLEESIDSYRVIVEIEAPDMRVMITEHPAVPGSTALVNSQVDQTYVAREFLEFFNKALAARELMMKEAESDSMKEVTGSGTPLKSVSWTTGQVR